MIQERRAAQCFNYRVLGAGLWSDHYCYIQTLAASHSEAFAFRDQQVESIAIDPVYNKGKIYKRKKSYHCFLKGCQQIMKIPKQI